MSNSKEQFTEIKVDMHVAKLLDFIYPVQALSILKKGLSGELIERDSFRNFALNYFEGTDAIATNLHDFMNSSSDTNFAKCWQKANNNFHTNLVLLYSKTETRYLVINFVNVLKEILLC